MVKFISILLIIVSFCKSTYGEKISDASIYFLNNCIVGSQNASKQQINVNLETNNLEIEVSYPTKEENSMFKYNVNIDKEISTNDVVVTETFMGTKLLNTNWDFPKHTKLAYAYTTVDLKVYPYEKKITHNFNTLPTSDRKIIKAFKKTFGKEKLVNDNGASKCLSTKIVKLKESKKIKEPLPEDNTIIAASSGSGFFISNYGHLVTNFHVIDGCDTTSIFSSGRKLKASILSSDKINDLSILKVNYNPQSVFPVSNDDVSLLEDVIVAAFPLGKNVSAAIKTHKGVVTSLAGAGDNYSNFQTDAAINQGNSGGPIINQMGNVVGVAVASWVEEGVQGVHFGIKSSTLQTFLRSNGLNLPEPSNKDMSNKDLGKLITNATVYIECNMTVAKVKKMLNDSKNRKAFFSNVK